MLISVRPSINLNKIALCTSLLKHISINFAAAILVTINYVASLILSKKLDFVAEYNQQDFFTSIVFIIYVTFLFTVCALS